MRNYIIFFLWISVQFLPTTRCSAQGKIFTTAFENSNLVYITSIAQDRQGYIWFTSGVGGNTSGTGGLHRYDGKEIISRTHDQNDNNSLANNWGECLFIDSANIIWIGTYGSGLDR